MIKNALLKRNSGRRAQLAVIITFIIALIFVLFVAYVNIYRVTDVKIMTSQAVDRAALNLASQIGTMGRAFLEAPPFSGNPRQCINNFSFIIATILTAFLTAIAFVLFPNPAVLILGAAIGGALGASLSTLNGLDRSFRSMSLYNGFREAALFNALQGVVTDDVSLRRAGENTYIDDDLDIHGNPLNSYSIKSYDLSTIIEATNSLTKKYSRFAAWYQTRRFRWSGDGMLNAAITKFIEDPTMGLKRWVDIDVWDPNLWRVTDVSFLSWTAYFVNIYNQNDPDNPRCPSTEFPSWVKDQDYIRALRLRADNTNYDGFLTDKLIPLLVRLKNAFGNAATLTNCPDPSNCEDISRVAFDFQEFLIKAKDLFNIPQNERLITFEQWFNSFYVLDPNLIDPNTGVSIGHCPDRTTYDTGCTVFPAVCAQRNQLDDDVYERLTRDMCYIQDWIDRLNYIDINMIMPNIPPAHGSYCLQGRGSMYNECYQNLIICYCTEECNCDEYGCDICCVGNLCDQLGPYFQWGDYGTCTGPDGGHGNHPVCQVGDLFGAIPSWCCDVRSVSCVSNDDECDTCEIPLTSPNYSVHPAYEFQGRYSWKHTDPTASDGPTEVGQAVRVLRAIFEDLERIRMTIAQLAREYENESLPEILAIRNQVVYSWMDKKGLSHFARAFISDYPDSLPIYTEQVSETGWEWIGYREICYTLHYLRDEIEITVSRYDQDIPVAPWYDIRRRRNSLGAEYNLNNLRTITQDVMDDGKVDVSQGYIDDLTNNYAITSRARAAYGPTRPEIRIIQTEGE